MVSPSSGSRFAQAQPMLRKPSRLREVLTVIEDGQGDDFKDKISIDLGGRFTFELGEELETYADIFAHEQDHEVFGEDGLLSQYYSASQAMLTRCDMSMDESEDASHWHLECRTWDLAQRLYLERVKDAPTLPQRTHGASIRTLVQDLYDTDGSAAEAKIILDWLHDGYSDSMDFEMRNNPWFYTKDSIQTRKRAGLLSQKDKIVTSMDPDAPLRQGKRLAEEDQVYERNLVRAMFHHVRSGDYTQAAEIARQSGCYWRAASLQGCVEHYNPNLDEHVGEAEGAIHKPLWRRMCFALAQQSMFDTYEQALYGALCGDLRSVLPVVKTWEDRLWANYNALNQSKIEAYLASLDKLQTSTNFPITDFSYLTSYSILEGLLQCEDKAVSAEARLPLRVVQSRVVTNQVDTLVQDMYQQLQSIQQGGSPNASSNPHVIRVVVHFIFVVRRLEIALPEEAANAIIQAYVEILISANQENSVALYASQLPHSYAIESLARFYVHIEGEEARRSQIRLAQARNIDTRITILRTVELVFEELLTEARLADGTVKPILAELSEDEERSIRALEWTNLDETLKNETMVLGNQLFRCLLLSGRLSAARALGERLPDTLLVSQEMAEEEFVHHDEQIEDAQMRSAIEYIGYCTLVKAFSRYEEWKALIRERPQEMNGRRDPVGLRQWKTDLSRVRSDCIIIFKEILAGNWCDCTDLGLPEDSVDVEEMTSLRNMYVPEVVLKLHGVYAAQEGRDVAAAMNLAVDVADKLTVPMKISGSLETYVKEVSLLGPYLA